MYEHIIIRPKTAFPVIKHVNRIQVDRVQLRNYEVLNQVHLLQTDNDLAPVMGMVHMVSAASNWSDKHFMHDIEGDINEGHRVLVEKSRAGPFRHQSGRSTVMDRSAGVTYRKRSGAFEITVKRSAVKSEIDQVLQKLSMHRMSTYGSMVILIKGTRRYRLGKLTDINLTHLRELIEECLQQYGNCGIEITETNRAGTGALYKPGVHKARFKSKARRGKGLARA